MVQTLCFWVRIYSKKKRQGFLFPVFFLFSNASGPYFLYRFIHLLSNEVASEYFEPIILITLYNTRHQKKDMTKSYLLPTRWYIFLTSTLLIVCKKETDIWWITLIVSWLFGMAKTKVVLTLQ